MEMNEIQEMAKSLNKMIAMGKPVDVLQQALEKIYSPKTVKEIFFQARLLELQEKNPEMYKAQQEAFNQGENQGIIKGAVTAISVFLENGYSIDFVEELYKEKFSPEDLQEILSQVKYFAYVDLDALKPVQKEIYLQGYAHGIKPYIENGSLSLEELEESLIKEKKYTLENIKEIIDHIKEVL